MRISNTWRSYAISVGLIIGLQGYGQKLVLTPNDTIERVGFMEDLETLTISIQNPASAPLVLKWQKVSAAVPVGWEAAVCDNKICYAGLEDSGTMNPLDSSELGFLLLHITSKVNPGSAIVRYVVWDEMDTTKMDTLTFILRVELPSGMSTDKDVFSIRLYPNPANGALFIYTNKTEGFSYRISEVTGKSMEIGFSETGVLALSTIGYKPGLYSLSIPDENGQLQTFKFIVGN